MKTITKAMAAILSLTIALGCVGCGKNSSSSKDKKSSTAAETVEVGIKKVPLEERGKKIAFIGNSLTRRGRLPEQLGALLGDEYTVGNCAFDGYTLEQHVADFSDPEYRMYDFLSTADIVVFQDWAGFVPDSTGACIKELQKICKEDAQFYFLMTEFSGSADYQGEEWIDEGCIYEIKELGNVKIIPAALITSHVRNEYFSQESFFYDDGYHPQEPNGYFMALAFMMTVYGEDCLDADWNTMTDKGKDLIPGETDEEKAELMKAARQSAYDKFLEVWKNHIDYFE